MVQISFSRIKWSRDFDFDVGSCACKSCLRAKYPEKKLLVLKIILSTQKCESYYMIYDIINLDRNRYEYESTKTKEKWTNDVIAKKILRQFCQKWSILQVICLRIFTNFQKIYLSEYLSSNQEKCWFHTYYSTSDSICGETVVSMVPLIVGKWVLHHQ